MKRISLITLIAIVVSLVFTSCIEVAIKETIHGDGKLVTKLIDITEFSKIEIETYVEVNYSQEQNTGNLEFTVDGNLWEYYDICTNKDVLQIKLKKEHKNSLNLNPTKSLIKVSSELLDKISIAGSSDIVFCTDFNSENLRIGLAGSSKIIANQHQINIENCEVEIAGSATVKFKGQIRKTDINIAGSGKISALDCEMEQLSIDIAGSGNVEAHVTDILIVSIAGSGEVAYKGEPGTVKTNIAGSGKVIKL